MYQYDYPSGSSQSFNTDGDQYTFSCTAVAKQDNGTLLSHLFLDLSTPSSFLANRSGVMSIMLQTLVATLRSTEEYLSSSIAKILSADTEFAETIIATTRVPEFGDGLQNPTHCYRTLCRLNEVGRECLLPPPRVARLELLAADVDHASVISFAHSHSPFGVEMNKHFFIVFHIPSMILSTAFHRSSRASSESSLSPSDSVSRLSSRRSSPHPLTSSSRHSSPHLQMPSPTHGTLLQSCLSLSSSKHPSGEEFRLATSQGNEGFIFDSLGTMRPDIPDTFFIAPVDAPSPSNSAHKYGPPSTLTLPPHVSSMTSEAPMAINMNGGVESLFRFMGMEMSDPRVVDARCQQGRTLTHMVRNQRAMVSLLKQLGFSAPLFKKGGQIEVHGFTFHVPDVLVHLGWAVTSFDHKCTWYDWAEVAARSQWKGRIPGKDEANYKLYSLWRGIHYLWSADGPISTGQIPSARSTDPDKVCSAGITQHQLTSSKVNLSACLAPPSD